MIILYHGSTLSVEQPLANAGRANLDFGPGFYLTRLPNQAEEWALRLQLLRPYAKAWLNTYEFDLTSALNEGYRMMTFESYNRHWLDFIAASRHGEHPWQEYDIIEGGIANDRVVDTIEAYLSGLADIEHTLGKLVYAKPNNQICLRNQQLIDQHLHHIDSKLIAPSDIAASQEKGDTLC